MDDATNPTTPSVSRRGFALGLALLLGARLAPGATAGKNTGKKVTSILSRVKSQRELCEILGGGTLTVTVRPGGTTTTCKGGETDGWTCTNSSKKTRCFQTAPPPPFEPRDPGAHVDPGDGPGAEIPADPVLRRRSAG